MDSKIYLEKRVKNDLEENHGMEKINVKLNNDVSVSGTFYTFEKKNCWKCQTKLFYKKYLFIVLKNY